ncbi:MAG TPA: MFS transporter [Acidimicrobiales bacterium]|nr:MFS transporter [Acidimicrobiales bacterium]
MPVLRSARGRVLLGMAALAAVGVFDGALGVAWPSMRATFDQPLAALGAVYAAYTGAYFVTSLASGWVLERVGTGVAMLAIAGTAIAGTATFALAPGWSVVLVGAAVLGVSGGAADVTLNHEVAQHHGMRAIGFLHAAWGLGATAGPLVVTAFVAGGRTWRLAFVPVVVIQTVLLFAYVGVRRDWPAVPRRRDVPDDAEPLDRVGLAVSVALFVLYVGIEAGTGAWAFTLLTESRGLSAATAGAWTAAYWLALTAGRVALGISGERRSPDAVLSASVLAALASTALLWGDPAGVGHLALVPLGLSLASVFPVLVALTPVRLGVHRAARALGVQIAASAVGGVTFPAVLGLGAQAWGTDALAPMLTACAAGLALLHAGGRRPPRRTPR